MPAPELFGHIVFLQIAGVEYLASLEHGKDGGKDHSGDGDDGALLAPAFGYMLVLGFEVNALGGLDRRMCGLHQRRLQINPGTGDSHGFLFPGRLVVARRQSRPAAQTLGGTKLGHIRANFRDDRNGEITVNTRNGTKQGDLALVFGNQLVDFSVESGNSGVDIGEMLLNDANTLLLLGGHLEALDSGHDICGLLLGGTLKQGRAVSRVYDIRIQEVILNRRCGFTKHIGQDGIQRRVAHSESILEAIPFTRTHGDELVTVSGELAEHADLPAGNEAAGNKTHSEQVSDPPGILGIILIALHGRHPFGVGNNHTDAILKDIPNRNPVFARALHADILAVVVKEPLPESEQITTESRETLLVALRNKPVRFDDGGDEKGFMNIDATANRIREFHDDPPFLIERGRD